MAVAPRISQTATDHHRMLLNAQRYNLLRAPLCGTNNIVMIRSSLTPARVKNDGTEGDVGEDLRVGVDLVQGVQHSFQPLKRSSHSQKAIKESIKDFDKVIEKK